VTTDRPKVLVLASTFPRFRGDHVGRFLGEYVEQLGLPVTVLAPAAEGAAKEERWAKDVFVRRFGHPDGIAYGGGIPNNLRRRPWLAVRAPRFLQRWTQAALELAGEVDVIDAHWAAPAGLVGSYVSGKTGLPLRVVLHSGGVHALASLPLGSRMANRLSERASSVTAVSVATSERFGSLLEGQRPIGVVPMGIHAERSVSDIPDRSVGFRGRLVPVKGVDLLVSACVAAGASLVVAGAGPDRSALKAQAARQGCRARFIGPSDSTPPASIVAFPSRILESGRTEGTPVSLLEAMSSGAAIVASRAGGIEHVISDDRNGVLVPSGDLDQLSSALRELLDDPARRARLGAQAREDAQAYLWSAIAPQHREILCRVARA
jgi:glycosyltransferase involved in cell wall biosynthesis